MTDVAGDYLERVGTDRIPHATAPSGWVTAVVIFAAVVGAIAAGVAITQPSADRARNDSAQAQTNRSTCLSKLNANWRLAWSIEGVALDTPHGQRLSSVSAKALHLPADKQAVIAEAQARFIASAADDLRISDAANPICPFVPGDPGRTPEEPVRSATDALEARLRRTGHP